MDDCILVAGKKFHHDDSLNDRTSGGTLDVSFQSTCALWKSAYGTEYAVEGGMYRGEPPADYWSPAWNHQTANHISENSNQQAQHQHQPTFDAPFAATFDNPDSTAPPVWLSTDAIYEGQPTFIPANPRSRTKGVNANEQKENYLFGVPYPYLARGKAAGYYHVYTREGWAILLKRLKRTLSQAQQDYNTYLFTHCACSPKGLNHNQLAEYEASEEKYKELKDAFYFARAQFDSPGPGAMVPNNIITKYGLDQRQRSRSTGTYDDGYRYGGWYAAGCGGGTGKLCSFVLLFWFRFRTTVKLWLSFCFCEQN